MGWDRWDKMGGMERYKRDEMAIPSHPVPRLTWAHIRLELRGMGRGTGPNLTEAHQKSLL